MLILRYAAASPFARKVRIAADVLGLSDRIKLETADTNDPSEALRKQNPLGKIPTLVLENGEALYDSRVIVAYLDHLAGGQKLLPGGEDRFRAMRWEALGDGIADAAVLQVYEKRFRDEAHVSEKWLDHQAGKVARALTALEDDLPTLDAPPHIGAIACACALGYLDLRFGDTWRQRHPRIVAWLARFEAACPAFAATAVPA